MRKSDIFKWDFNPDNGLLKIHSLDDSQAARIQLPMPLVYRFDMQDWLNLEEIDRGMKRPIFRISYMFQNGLNRELMYENELGRAIAFFVMNVLPKLPCKEFSKGKITLHKSRNGFANPGTSYIEPSQRLALLIEPDPVFGMRQTRILVKWDGASQSKLDSIKSLREVCNLGLKEAKEIVDEVWNSSNTVDVTKFIRPEHRGRVEYQFKGLVTILEQSPHNP